MTQISENLLRTRARIERACHACGRDPGQVGLLAVSKGQNEMAIRQALQAGQTEFGENYLQEALTKLRQLPREGLTWHFIGPIQSNKTQDIAEHFDWVHTVDRLKVAQRLSMQRPANLVPLNVCVQVNISAEASKSGCTPDQATQLCQAVASLPQLRLRGLMAIPAPGGGRAPYARLRELREVIDASGLRLDTVSAGMSEDLEDAIAEGATLVRVGTAIFGKRL